jgi:hypothetical protein
VTSTDLWKPACMAGCFVLAVAAMHVGGVRDADAAKVRKKPPVQPLSPPPVASSAGTPPVEVPQPRPVADPVPSIPYPTAGLVCLYGESKDPETQATRCLAPEELNPPRLIIVNSRPLAEQLGMLSARGVEEGPEAGSEPENPKARVVSVSFENGAVGGALRNLRAQTDDMAACVDENGGLRAASARLKLMFFVRPNHKASGMIVASARNVPPPVVRCIRKVIEDGVVGRPSTDAVGVTTLIELKDIDR